MAVQFNLTFAVSGNGGTVRLLPAPEHVAVVRTYPGGKHPQDTASRFTFLVPAAEITVRGGQVSVSGLVEDHERLTQRRSADKPSEPPADQNNLSQKRFTLKISQQPVGPLLKLLAKKIGLELAMDEQAIAAAGISLDQRVSFSVKDATVDELLARPPSPPDWKSTAATPRSKSAPSSFCSQKRNSGDIPSRACSRHIYGQSWVARIACLSGPHERQEASVRASCAFGTPIASYRGHPAAMSLLGLEIGPAVLSYSATRPRQSAVPGIGIRD